MPTQPKKTSVFGGSSIFGGGLFGSSLDDLDNPDVLLELARQQGGAIADVANEIVHPEKSFLSKLGSMSKKSLGFVLDGLALPSEFVAGVLSPDLTVKEAIKEDVRVSEVLLGEPDTSKTGLHRVGSFTFRLLTDILLDPITYLTFGGAQGIFGTSLAKRLVVGEEAVNLTKQGKNLFAKRLQMQRNGLRITGEKNGLSGVELDDFVKKTLDADPDQEFIKRAFIRLAKKDKAFAHEFIDAGGIKYFGQTILSGQRIAATMRAIPGMTTLDNITEPARNVLGSAFSTKRNMAGVIPEGGVSVRQTALDMSQYRTIVNLESKVATGRSFAIQADEDILVRQAVELQRPPADKRLGKIYDKYLKMGREQLKRERKAGLRTSELEGFVPHVLVDERVRPFLPFRTPPSVGAKFAETARRLGKFKKVGTEETAIGDVGVLGLERAKELGPPDFAALKAEGIVDKGGKVKKGTQLFQKDGELFYRVPATIEEIEKGIGREGLFEKSFLVAMTKRDAQIDRAITMRNFINDISQKMGKRRSLAPSNYVEARVTGLQGEKFSLSQFQTARNGEDLLFHPAIANMVEEFTGQLINDAPTQKILEQFDKIQNAWKATVTYIWPQFNGRNALSNVLLNLLDLGRHALDPARHAQATSIIKDHLDIEGLAISAHGFETKIETFKKPIIKPVTKTRTKQIQTTRLVVDEDELIATLEEGRSIKLPSQEVDETRLLPAPEATQSKALVKGKTLEQINAERARLKIKAMTPKEFTELAAKDVDNLRLTQEARGIMRGFEEAEVSGLGTVFEADKETGVGKLAAGFGMDLRGREARAVRDIHLEQDPIKRARLEDAFTELSQKHKRIAKKNLDKKIEEEFFAMFPYKLKKGNRPKFLEMLGNSISQWGGVDAAKRGAANHLHYLEDQKQALREAVRKFSKSDGSGAAFAEALIGKKLTAQSKIMANDIAQELGYSGYDEMYGIIKPVMRQKVEVQDVVEKFTEREIVGFTDEQIEKVIWKDPKEGKRYLQIMNKEAFVDDLGTTYSYAELRDVIRQNNIGLSPYLDITGASDIRRSNKERYAEFFADTFGQRKKAHLLNPFKFMRSVASFIEEEARILNFLENLKVTGDPHLAAKRTKMFLIDYQNLTNFEKMFMRRVLPFYTFTKNNLITHARALATVPGRIEAQFTAIHDLGEVLSGGADISDEERELLPEWMKRGIALVKERRGQNAKIFASFDTPLEAAFETLNTDAILGMVTPLVKFPTEQAIGFDIFRGKAISDVTNASAYKYAPKPFRDLIGYVEVHGKRSDGTPYTTEVALRPKMMHALNQFPIGSRMLTTLKNMGYADGPTERLLQGLLGISTRDVNFDSLLKQEEARLRDELTKELDDAGIVYEFKRTAISKD